MREHQRQHERRAHDDRAEDRHEHQRDPLPDVCAWLLGMERLRERIVGEAAIVLGRNRTGGCYDAQTALFFWSRVSFFSSSPASFFQLVFG